jgi:hypothetical protein
VATLDDSFILARSLVDDLVADVNTVARMTAAGKSAYRRLQRKIASNGGKIMQAETDLQLTAGQTSITAASTPALPSDFLWPRKLREFVTGQLASTATDMIQVDELPTRDQDGGALREWEFRDTGIFLVGSTVATTVRMRYEQYLDELVDDTSDLLILGCEDAIGYRIAAHMARSRGQRDMWLDYTREAEELEKELINNLVRVEQSISRRPRGYNDW